MDGLRAAGRKRPNFSELQTLTRAFPFQVQVARAQLKRFYGSLRRGARKKRWF
jgi:hypothetical protein